MLRAPGLAARCRWWCRCVCGEGREVVAVGEFASLHLRGMRSACVSQDHTCEQKTPSMPRYRER
ncbi:hypothetical protein DZD52_03550 [Xanthomonas nasturtii]|uniref:Uncharacterized protein n=1 Tax=Xanthomonas nasturtii TaxID=1843581 RepID=A0A3E1KR27_9XANT|nr:hypothetical protein DZD52_03550 [Xanthomonas nasturtii]